VTEVGRRLFIRRRLFVERAHSLRANSLREGGTGRRPFVERRGCSLKAIH